ncbi:MAG: hypothetical protein NTZ80_01690 [Patescibacteria group bacterium]|nr:hypothetical protein [Patescibacteria group bacterium]
MPICSKCRSQFEIAQEDLLFYDKISPVFSNKKFQICAPTLCPECRQQRRLCFRNERKLYKRKCDFSGKQIVSAYSPEKPCTVYDSEIWWSDKWDAFNYGRDFDFQRPFFEQFDELQKIVPRPALVNMSSENSIYTNHAVYNKNCFMCVNTGYSEDCLYVTNYSIYDKNCVDCLAIQNCELCYFCVDVKQGYSCSFLYRCEDCDNSNFCYDCRSCSNCFGCFNLRKKSYCIYNKQYSKDDYLGELAKIQKSSWTDLIAIYNKFWALVKQKAIHQGIMIEKCENCTGDRLTNDKNTRHSYYTFDAEDCAYCYDAGAIKNCFDITEPYKGELEYETHACNINYNIMFCSKCYENSNLSYCQYCWYSSDLFGCFGMKRQKYCILNKQYSKQEYEELVPKIIEHMQKSTPLSPPYPRGVEWSQFFPPSLSPFGYNEVIANEYFPLDKKQAQEQGFNWSDYESPLPKVEKIIKADELDRDQKFLIQESNDILNYAVECSQTQRPFIIQKAELEFYRKMNLPISHLHPDIRHQMRMDLRNPRKLWDRACQKCRLQIQTSYSPDRPETVYCEKCYLGTVY